METSATSRRLRLVEDAAVDDGQSVLRAQRGESAAQRELFLRHAQPLRQWVAGIALGRADVDDIVQDSFIIAFERLRSLKDVNAFRPWLRSIAVSRLRRKFRTQNMLRKLGLSGPGAAPVFPIAANAPPEVVSEAKRLTSLLQSLPAEEGLALVLRRVDGYQLEEIATMMNLSLATVKRRLNAAERLLDTARGEDHD
jgi:RNA polymerase sigma-70 factor, ECF subfamily